jgi:hypothetical protein
MSFKLHHQYYTLVASLPPLSRFDRAERLPINRVRLQERFTMLQPRHAEKMQRAAAFLQWQHHPDKVTDADMVADYERLMKKVVSPTLRDMIQFQADIRTVMVALRRRRRGLPRPAASEPWGVGRLVAHILRNWDEPNFKLLPFYPWLPKAREFLEAGETLALERLLLRLVWDHADRVAQVAKGHTFNFAAVLAYFFKWDTIECWLSYDPAPAKTRLDQLLAEVTDGHRPSFK